MNKISACIVVKNEEIIRRCLKSLYGFVDEIIIVHDGECGDNTLDICREYTNKIYVQKDCGNCNPHRPFSFEKASNNWILQIDADEYLSKKMCMSIKDLAGRKNVDAYEFLWPIWDGQKYITKSWPHKRCLFRKSKATFLGIPNYVSDIQGRILKSNLILHHKPVYNNFSWKVFKEKLIPKAKIQAGYYLKNFQDIEKFNSNLIDWSYKIKFRVKFPILLMPVEFLVTFWKNLQSGAYKDGYVGLKISFMFGLYRVIMNYYIFRLKLKK